ncbi:MAG: TraR/DksA C4-type zinc finger protein [Pseudomonadota bacterium]|nr:TraR/DksA C4-type zinc finger protein [Pseudomonadota bacterium]
MTPDQIARVRRRLEELRAEVEGAGNIAVRAEDIGPVPSAADEDEAPFREMDQSIASSRNRVRADQLLRIAVAERRLEEDPDSFGLCEKCEEPIPPRRLELLPFVRKCVDCQSAAEVRSSKPVRKKVTDYQE